MPSQRPTEELNFPIGCRDPIDLSGYRWNLPIHLIEGEENENLPVFFSVGGTGVRWVPLVEVILCVFYLVKQQEQQTKMG